MFRHTNHYTGLYLSSLQLVLGSWKRHQGRLCRRSGSLLWYQCSKFRVLPHIILIFLKTLLWNSCTSSIGLFFQLILSPGVWSGSHLLPRLYNLSQCKQLAKLLTYTISVKGHIQEHVVAVAIFANTLFLFVKADMPRATRLCNVTEDGEIELQNATVGNCNINLDILEEQVCSMAHVIGNRKETWWSNQCFLKLSN